MLLRTEGKERCDTFRELIHTVMGWYRGISQYTESLHCVKIKLTKRSNKRQSRL